MAKPTDFEKLGVFYLGRPWNLVAKKPHEGLLLYDSKDLVTHAVCVGMTGSGKTGLCLSLLEEAALDGIPAIAIDPKGDLPNLLLTFPRLAPEDFRPWVNEDDARRKGLSVDDFARQQAETWQKGLAAWGQDGARIQRLRDAADFAVYTPGSTAGIPLSIIRSFACPPPAIREDAELLRERVATTATSLLGLVGIEADPVKSREHILISTLLDTAWRQGQDLDLAALIERIQSPPVARVGVLDLESFFPAKARFELAMALNNLLASPGFSAWMEGEPLDVGAMLHTAEGKPRIAIVSIAHLGDAERMFFVSLLLTQVLGWMRSQPGTSSLRAILYMDEIFGYFPPVANPPSKTPLLTLLKQARAFGVGVVLATQNPVDLDYKGLANAGTWFIGRLQTERDKARVLEGLEGAAASAGGRFDRQRMEETLAGLGSRIFLMNNVHEDAPEVFETRWAMCYLRGPMTRTQIKTLMDARRPAVTTSTEAVPGAAATARARATPPDPAAAVTAGPSGGASPTATVAATAGAAATPRREGSPRPVLPPDIPQHFIPVRQPAPPGATLVYEPMVLGSAAVRFTDRKAGVDVTRDVVYVAPIGTGAVAVTWDEAQELGVPLADLESAPAEGAAFGELPSGAARKKSYDAWAKDLGGWLYRTQKLELLRGASARLVQAPDESERDFRIRLQNGGREQRDQALERLKATYAPRLASLEQRIQRAEQAVDREAEQVTQQGLQTAISVGATLLGSLLGRKSLSASTLGRATTAARGAGRVLKERQDVGRARETLEELRRQREELDAAFKAEADTLAASLHASAEALERVTISPTKQNIAVRLVALAWAPTWRDAQGNVTPAWG